MEGVHVRGVGIRIVVGMIPRLTQTHFLSSSSSSSSSFSLSLSLIYYVHVCQQQVRLFFFYGSPTEASPVDWRRCLVFCDTALMCAVPDDHTCQDKRKKQRPTSMRSRKRASSLHMWSQWKTSILPLCVFPSTFHQGNRDLLPLFLCRYSEFSLYAKFLEQTVVEMTAL
jgi:hypothetical protein